MSKTTTKKTQDYYDYAYNRNLQKVKKYQFFDKIFKIKNKSAATVYAEGRYTEVLDLLKEVEICTNKEKNDMDKEDMRKILEIQKDIHTKITDGLCALIGKENCEYILDFEDEEGSGVGLYILMEIFAEIYAIAKGGDPSADDDFREENEKK